MDYKLDIEKLGHPLLKELLGELIPVFAKLKINFYIVGATARDIILEIHNISPDRRTKDIDFAIAIDNWEEFDNLEKEMLSHANFTKDPKQKQRFFYLNDFEIDIVPFGQIADEKDKIFWPPKKNFAMTILGFKEIESETIIVNIGGFEIKVASLDGIFLLKLFAWKDRNIRGNKDADDLGFILQNYLNINEERAATKHYNEVYEIETFTSIKAGAVLLGIDISKILENSEHTKEKLKSIVQTELDLNEKSILFNQIIETNRISYNEIYDAFLLFNQQLK